MYFKEHIQEEGAKSKDILIKDGFLPRVTTEDEKKKNDTSNNCYTCFNNNTKTYT